ncbi:hypothetical protein PNOK_0121400 [Pyrrhoderma noxium]|uniref:Uncharacterized protein n=1 Tax=Pyrrhoderma noxium TaxID=2282107 RepID=A0A286UX30_9AGAM|nr:hypothetical protein PNOK_0121400 [Pyrrhoderma noxium]
MSTTVVAPFRYTTDLSKRSIQATIDQYTFNILRIIPPDAEYTVYLQRAAQESRVNEAEEIWRVTIDILDVVIAHNSSTGTISLQISVRVPIIGDVTVGQVSGSLINGVNISVGYPDVLNAEKANLLSSLSKECLSAYGFNKDGNSNDVYIIDPINV